jgi:predicted DNA-binding transcriptional regulator YafY
MKNRSYDKKFLRLVVIIRHLGTDGYVTTPALAREFNVTIRTVQRDISLIEQGGFPLVRTSSGWQFMEGFQFSFDFKQRLSV